MPLVNLTGRWTRSHFDMVLSVLFVSLSSSPLFFISKIVSNESYAKNWHKVQRVWQEFVTEQKKELCNAGSTNFSTRTTTTKDVFFLLLLVNNEHMKNKNINDDTEETEEWAWLQTDSSNKSVYKVTKKTLLPNITCVCVYYPWQTLLSCSYRKLL